MTTVDYIFADIDAISIILSCKSLPMTYLNISDHPPLIAELTSKINIKYRLNPMYSTTSIHG